MSLESTSRRRELLQVAGTLLAILVGTAVVSRMLVEAWDARGLAYHLSHGAARVTGFGIDGVVVFAAVLVLTWVVLFTLDDDKHVQGALLLVAVFGVFVPSLVLMGRWLGTVDFLGHPVAIVAGVLVGVLTVAVDANVPALQGGGRRRFPMAARALYATTVFVLVAGFIERHLVYRSPIIVVEAAATPESTTAGPLVLILELVATLAVIYLMGYFVRYSDVTNVAISSPDDEALASFLGGLYAEADIQYGARPVEGGHILNSARSAQHSQPRIDSRVAFRFRPGDLLGRWREVSYENIRPVSEEDIGPLREIAKERSSLTSRLRHGFKRQLLLTAPSFLTNALRSSGGRHLDRIVRADAVLLVAPVSDVLREQSENPVGETELENRIRDRTYLDVYDEICGICSRSTMPTVMIVTTDADQVLDAHDSKSVSSEQFIRFLRKDVLGLSQSCRVVPVTRGQGERDGFAELTRIL
jgi:hypothetical protein